MLRLIVPAVLLCILPQLTRAQETQRATTFMDVFPAATIGSATGAVIGYQVGTTLRFLGSDPESAKHKEGVLLGLVSATLASATAVWLVERNDNTNIGYRDALNAALIGSLPALLVASAVTWKAPASMEGWLGTITFSILHGGFTSALAARHSRHSLSNAQ